MDWRKVVDRLYTEAAEAETGSKDFPEAFRFHIALHVGLMESLASAFEAGSATNPAPEWTKPSGDDWRPIADVLSEARTAGFQEGMNAVRAIVCGEWNKHAQSSLKVGLSSAREETFTATVLRAIDTYSGERAIVPAQDKYKHETKET